MKTWLTRFGVLATAVLAAATFGVSAAAADDTAGPTAQSLFASGIAGGDPYYTAQGRRVYVCANQVIDQGDSPTGVKSVTADIRSFGLIYPPTYDLVYLSHFPMGNNPAKTGICVPPIANDWEVDWPARKPLADGPYTYSVTMCDNATPTSNCTTQPAVPPTDCGTNPQQDGCLTVDNVAPKGTDVQTADGGGTQGKPQQGDMVTYSYSEVMNRYLASETPHDVVVHIDNTGSNDTLTVWNNVNSHLDGYEGTIKLGKDYVSSNRTFGATGTKSSIVRNGNQVTITLGTPSGSVNTVNSSGTMVWTPSGATDRAGNGVQTTAANESGAADKDF